MLRSMRILLLSSLVFVAPVLATAAQTVNKPNPTDQDQAQTEAKAKALAEAIAACDHGASVPLDPEAKAAPVQFLELYPEDFDLTKLKTLQGKCQQAMVGAPKQKRLHLQWLRIAVLLNEPGSEWLLPQLQAYAEKGSAEANFLLFQLFVSNRNRTDRAPIPISREQALAALQKAADKGHLQALQDLLSQYSRGPLLRRDGRKAFETAQRIMDAPRQGSAPGRFETHIRSRMPLVMALTALEEKGFTPNEQREAFALVAAEVEADPGLSFPFLAYARALRFGLGTAKDPVKARKALEARAAKDKDVVPMLADMIARGEGGPADVKRALAMLQTEKLLRVNDAGAVLAGLLLDPKIAGSRPREAVLALSRSYDLDDRIKLAGLLLDYHPRIEFKESLLKDLADAAEAGEPGAGLALARLKLSDNSDFFDINGARAVLKPLVDQGDREAIWLYAASQFDNQHSITSITGFENPGFSEEQVKDLIEEGMAKKESQAFLLHAKLLRRGVIYPQDDEKATKMLIEAANLGNVEAMLLLGKAYDDGLGIAKNPRERLRAWRLAAQKGSLKARQNLANAFTFDTFDKLLTLQEGVTGRIVLYNNGIGRRLDGLGGGDMAQIEFVGLFDGRAMEAGSDAVAEAVMNAFREAPAGLEEKTLVGLGKAMPDEVRVAIEKKLQADGFYRGAPNGYFGPEVRKALADWVDAKGPLEMASAEPDTQDVQAAADKTDAVPRVILDRVRDKAFKQAMAAKSDKQKLAALKQLNILARYGDLAPRWALVRNYHQARVVRKAVTPAEITRYGLDILVTKPEGMDKAEFEFIFDVTQIAQDGKSSLFGDAVLAAIRDDKRLQDPLTLGSIMKQFIFAPEACDAVLRSARKAGIQGLGEDGCGEDVLKGMIDYAKKKGESGIAATARKEAALEIKSLDAQAAK
jgi:TPR repeat protein